MEARHCAGAEMQDMMAYAASVGSEAAKREGPRVHRQRQRRHRALVRHAARLRHDAAFADRLCRLHAARGRDVPRDVSRRTDDRAGRLFRPRDHRCARGMRAVSRPAAIGPAVIPPGHAWRTLHGGARSGGELRGAGAPRARRDPAISQRDGTALSGRHRRFRRRDLHPELADVRPSRQYITPVPAQQRLGPRWYTGSADAISSR